MSFYFMLFIMLFTGILGGIVNFLLPDNNPTKKEYIKPLANCIFLGLGATLLVPLFLELAQSKLMDNIRFDFKLQSTATLPKDSFDNKLTVVLNTKENTDSLKIAKIQALTKEKPTTTDNTNTNQGKNYLLWTAYCLLAAAAGFKFINMLIAGVFKANKIEELQTEKAKVEEENKKRKMQGQKSQQEELKNIISNNVVHTTNIKGMMEEAKLSKTTDSMVLSLPPITVENDPQKGRFGGKEIGNGRVLKGNVVPTENEDYFDVYLSVESTDDQKPLNEDVLFFLHDSFSPSIIKVTPVDGKIAEVNRLIAYGAFTVGVVTDNGATMLELDLATDNKNVKDKALKKFIER